MMGCIPLFLPGYPMDLLQKSHNSVALRRQDCHPGHNSLALVSSKKASCRDCSDADGDGGPRCCDAERQKHKNLLNYAVHYSIQPAPCRHIITVRNCSSGLPGFLVSLAMESL
jgi:hypothetical protein